MSDDGPQQPAPGSPDLAPQSASLPRVLEQLVEALAGRVVEMDAALHRIDYEGLAAAAAQLKGACGESGHPALAQRAAELERLARAQSVHDCRRALDQLKVLCARAITPGDHE